MRNFIFSTTHQWINWTVLGLGIVAVGYIEAHPMFPYNLFPG
jgi:hypothetical protein